MTKTELISAIQQADLLPIPIKDEADELKAAFDGTLTEFLATAKALGSKAVLVCSYQFDEEDFLDDLDDEEDGFLVEEEEEDDEAEGDLAERFPVLAKYKKYLGQDCLFSLTATGGVLELNLDLVEGWYLNFEQDLDQAQEEAG